MKTKGFVYRSDFEGLYLRKHSFKSGPFDETKLKTYNALIKKFAWKAYSYNVSLFHKVGMDLVDLESIGMSYLYTFFSNPCSIKFDKKLDEYRILHRHLRQRYEHLIIFTRRKVKGIVDSTNYTEEHMDGKASCEHVFIIDQIASTQETPEKLALSKEFSNKVDSYLKDVLEEVYPVNEGTLKKIKINDADFKKICLFHIVSHYETPSRFSNSVTLDTWVKRKITKKINDFMININESYEKNDIKNISKKVNKILEMDFDA
jgi:hypothetical protein